MFFIDIRKEGSTLYAHLEGRLTKRHTHQIEDYLIPYIIKNDIKKLCCDCSKLKKVDLEGKYALLNTKIQMKKQHGNFLLCNMKKSIKESLLGYHFKIVNLRKAEV